MKFGRLDGILDRGWPEATVSIEWGTQDGVLTAGPDMITFAQGSTGGYVPLGGLSARGTLMEPFQVEGSRSP